MERVDKIEREKKYPQACLWDFNGVMVDDFLLQLEAWSRMSQKLRGKAVSHDEMIHQIRGVPSKDTLKWMSKEKIDEDTLEKLAKEKDAIVQELFNTSPLFCLNNGLVKFLDELHKRNIPITIATSSRPEIFEFSFRKLNLERWFKWEDVVFNDGSYPGKPAPDAYLIAAKKIGINPEDCVVVEDAKSGIQSAFSAGAKVIAVNSDKERLSELEKMPGVIKGIKDFTELTVDEIFGPAKNP